MLSLRDQLADLTERIARAQARVSQQQAHVESLIGRGYDAADASALLELMASTVELMRGVQATLEEFYREREAH